MTEVHTRIAIAVEDSQIDKLLKDPRLATSHAAGTDAEFVRSAAISSLLCITAHLSDAADIIGFLCIDEGIEGTGQPSSWLQQETLQRGYNTANTCCIRTVSSSPEHEVAAIPAMLRAAFTAMLDITSIILVMDTEIQFSSAGLASCFSLVASNRTQGQYLYDCQRDSILQPLTVRKARVEDHDDLLPLLLAEQQLRPDLAQLPQWCAPNEPFALTRLISDQTADYCVMVAEVDSKVVGLLAVSSTVDVASLQEHFDLHPYDSFFAPKEYDELYSAAKQAVLSTKRDDLTARWNQQQQLQHQHSQTQSEGQAAEDTASTQEFTALEGLGEEQQQQPAFDDTAVDAQHDEIMEVLLDLIRGRAEQGAASVLQIAMLCMQPDYAPRAHELLAPLLEMFPGKQYVIAVLPTSCPEPPIMQVLTRVPALPGHLDADVLFLFNRDGLRTDFQVRLASPADQGPVVELLSGGDDEAVAFAEAVAGGHAVVATCQDVIVGACTVLPQVDTSMLQRDFLVAELVHPRVLESGGPAELDLLLLNPVFQHRSRQLLLGALRLLGRSALFYALPSGQAPPPTLPVLHQVPARHNAVLRSHPYVGHAADANNTAASPAADFALYAFTRQLAFAPRRPVNSKVVVVGASECGLAFVEALLLHRELAFNNIVLLAAGGVAIPASLGDGIGRMGLEARVAIVDSSVVGLDRDAHIVELTDGSTLHYDQLVLAPELCDQTPARLAAGNPDIQHNLIDLIQLQEEFSTLDGSTMSSIVVLGNTTSALTAIKLLNERGAQGKVRWVAEPGPESSELQLLRRLARELAAPAVPEPTIASIKEITVQEGSTSCIVDLEVAGSKELWCLPTDLLVCCNEPDIDHGLFTALNSCSIVYDGRIVVDDALRTSDPHIYAVGDVARLSRAAGSGGLLLQHYNARELGSCLADSLASLFLDGQRPSHPLPKLNRGKAMQCSVPSGHHFCLVGKPAALQQPHVKPQKGFQAMSTISDTSICEIVMDPHGEVYSIAYYGKEPPSLARLVPLIGLPSTYLGNLPKEHEAGRVEDLTPVLAQPWADVLSHDLFARFRTALLRSACGQAGATGQLPPATQAAGALLHFLKQHARELPGVTLMTAE